MNGLLFVKENSHLFWGGLSVGITQYWLTV